MKQLKSFSVSKLSSVDKTKLNLFKEMGTSFAEQANISKKISSYTAFSIWAFPLKLSSLEIHFESLGFVTSGLISN